MADDVGAPRRYSEEEIGRILKRATEMQVAEPAGQGPGGMTLRELEEIALEAGIDPRHLRRAAMELEPGSPEASFWTRVLGHPPQVRLEAAVPGELPVEGFESLVAIIQHVAREHGQASLVGRTLTWQGETATGTRSTMVVVGVRDGETRVRVEERLQGLAGQLFGGLVGGVGVGAGVGVGVGLGAALGSALFSAAFPVGALGLGYITARAAFRSQAGARRRALSELLDRLVGEVSDRVTESALPAPGSPRSLPRG
jgi:hypothetical protein